MDSQGVVPGHSSYVEGLARVSSPARCLLCLSASTLRYSSASRETTWSGTGPTATPVLGEKRFIPWLANDKGVVYGVKDASTYYDIKNGTLPPGGFGEDVPWVGRYGNGPKMVRLPPATQATPIAGADFDFTLGGVNSAGWMVGNTSFKASLYRDGVLTDISVPQNYTTDAPKGINDAGVIVGTQDTSDGLATFTRRPMRWVDGQPTMLGGPELEGATALAINASGQVLLNDVTLADGVKGRALWFNGVLTPLTPSTPTADTYARATAMNDSGTVVGCIRPFQRYQTDVLQGVKPFIWKNGVMTDLKQWLLSKGAPLPANVQLACPSALNNSGSILTYYFNGTTITWIRLNAKP